MLHESKGINYESDKNMPNAAHIGHKLTAIRKDRHDSQDFSHDSYKKAFVCLI